MGCEEDHWEQTEGRGDWVGRQHAEYDGEGVGPQGFHHQTADTKPTTAEYSHPGSLTRLLEAEILVKYQDGTTT